MERSRESRAIGHMENKAANVKEIVRCGKQS
jgi:hypothetical protein